MPQHSHSRGSDDAADDVLRYVLLGCISILIGIVQIIGSYFSGSISLFSDTIHVASDGLGFFISAYVTRKVLVFRLSHEKEAEVRSFWMRASGFILLPSLFGILYEAWERFMNPVHVIGLGVMFAAAIGAGGNYWQLRFMPHQDNTNARMQRLHVISDLLSSLAVIGAGLAIWIFGSSWIDPTLSILMALWIGVQTVRMMWTGESSHDHSHH